MACPSVVMSWFTPGWLKVLQILYAGAGGYSLEQWSPTFFGTRDKFSPTWGGGGFRMIQAHYIYCALYFYYISSISDDPALGPGGWGPLPGGPSVYPMRGL